VKRLVAVLIFVCCVAAFSHASDRDVQAVVSALEQRYGLHHTDIPWMAKPFMKSSGLPRDVGLFENQAIPASVSLQELESLASAALGAEWHAFVRVSSRRDNERTLVFAKPEGKHMILLIVSAEAHETTVVKTRLDGTETGKWLNNPENESEKKAEHQ
jgi:hypothetical protein